MEQVCQELGRSCPDGVCVGQIDAAFLSVLHTTYQATFVVHIRTLRKTRVRKSG